MPDEKYFCLFLCRSSNKAFISPVVLKINLIVDEEGGSNDRVIKIIISWDILEEISVSEHEIAYDRLREILDSYDILWGDSWMANYLQR